MVEKFITKRYFFGVELLYRAVSYPIFAATVIAFFCPFIKRIKNSSCRTCALRSSAAGSGSPRFRSFHIGLFRYHSSIFDFWS